MLRMSLEFWPEDFGFCNPPSRSALADGKNMKHKLNMNINERTMYKLTITVVFHVFVIFVIYVPCIFVGFNLSYIYSIFIVRAISTCGKLIIFS